MTSLKGRRAIRQCVLLDGDEDQDVCGRRNLTLVVRANVVFFTARKCCMTPPRPDISATTLTPSGDAFGVDYLELTNPAASRALTLLLVRSQS